MRISCISIVDKLRDQLTEKDKQLTEKDLIIKKLKQRLEKK